MLKVKYIILYGDSWRRSGPIERIFKDEKEYKNFIDLVYSEMDDIEIISKEEKWKNENYI